jgi:hypothetical protein
MHFVCCPIGEANNATQLRQRSVKILVFFERDLQTVIDGSHRLWRNVVELALIEREELGGCTGLAPGPYQS